MARKNTKNRPVPSGDGFMEGTGTGDIRAALKAEQGRGGNAKAALILLACLWRREGWTGSDISSRLGRSSSAVYDWLSRMHRGGLDARYDRGRPGRHRKIDPGKRQSISEAIDRKPAGCGMKSGVWTGRLILIVLSDMFGIAGISPSTAYRTMHRMNKSWRKPGRE